MEHVKDNIYAECISPGCNVGVIATSKGTVIADTPLMSHQASAMAEELSAGNHQPVRYIVMTHGHGDHILGTDLFGEDVLIFGNRGIREPHTSTWPTRTHFYDTNPAKSPSTVSALAGGACLSEP